MTTPARQFHLGDILSITTSRMLSPTGMGGVHEIVTHMIGELATDMACIEERARCAAALLAQHPQLARLVDAGDKIDPSTVDAWLTKQITQFGERLAVEALANGRCEVRR